MGTQRAETVGLKPSFADVLAGPSTARRKPVRTGPTIIGPETSSPVARHGQTSVSKAQQPSVDMSTSTSKEDINGAMSNLEVKDATSSLEAPNDDARFGTENPHRTTDEDHTQVSSSTTGQSQDGKSTASGMTFAFDEKESLRPDDSASIQAADDDCAGSGPISGAPNSRIGSEAGGRAFVNQLNGIAMAAPQSTSGPNATAPGDGQATKDQILSTGLEPPPGATQLPIISQAGFTIAPRPPIPFGDLQPDEKLFEALESSKDRIFLLRLETKIIDFIKDSTLAKIQLPPCNSFCRLLAHKLADYYALSHVVDNAQNSVTLFKTPFCRMPAPLAELARDAVQDAGTGPAAAAPAMTIMRRPDLTKDGRALSSGAPTTESSLVPSKAGSEAGDETKQGAGTPSPPESTLAKEKASLTLAQREARYREKREQIFGPQSESNETNEVLNDASRVSSRNEERKKKKKQRNANDDFEARSQFNAYYPIATYGTANPYTQGITAGPAYNPYAFLPPVQHQSPGPFMGQVLQQPAYAQQLQSYPVPQAYTVPHGMNALPPFGNQSGYSGYENHHNQQYFAPMPPHMVASQPSSTLSSPSLEANGPFYTPSPLGAEIHTPPNFYQQQYQPNGSQQQQGYATGMHYHSQKQLQQYMAPGSPTHATGVQRARHAPFNPSTRSFIPNGNAVAWNRPEVQNAQGMNNHGPAISAPQGGQPSHPTSCLATTNTISKDQYPPNPARKPTLQKNESSSPATSSLSKWGTPANLPPKPPPPEAPGMPDSLPSNNQFTPNIQPMTAGQPMPNFQNGVYSMPRAAR